MAASELTQHCWAIAEKIGKPYSDSRKAFGAVCDEMMTVKIQRHLALVIAEHVAKWKETGNPYHMDLAFILLAQQGITEGTETMKIEALAAAGARFNGDPAGTAECIKNDDAESAALNFMVNLVIRGMSVTDASRKAASYYAMRFPAQKRKKASTLEGYYSKKIRATGRESAMKIAHQTMPVEWDEQWKAIANAIPDCSDELMGSRR